MLLWYWVDFGNYWIHNYDLAKWCNATPSALLVYIDTCITPVILGCAVIPSGQYQHRQLAMVM